MNSEQNTNNSASLNRALSALGLGIRRMWWLVLLLTILLAAAFAYRSWTSYTPLYTASETFTVYTKNDSQAQYAQTNTAIAEQMVKTFPNILNSGMLSDLVKADLKVDYLPTINAEAVEEVNLIKLSVTGTDPNFCYKYIYVFLPDKVLVYEIFAATPYINRHLLSNEDMNDPAELEKLISGIMSSLDKRANFRDGMEFDFENDRFIALSTCLEGDNTQRYLVFGRLTEEIPAA